MSSSLLQSSNIVGIVCRDQFEVLFQLPTSKSYDRASLSHLHFLNHRRHLHRHELLPGTNASLFHRLHCSDERQQQKQKQIRSIVSMAKKRFSEFESSKMLTSMVAEYDDDDDGDSSLPVEMNIFDRLALAWTILFPSKKKKVKASSPAQIAKQRLKMILISDRCSVNDSAKKKIVKNIVGALADFVEIEPEDKVRLNVCADPELGTVYSVSVPVRRVRHQFQEEEEPEQEMEGEEEEEEEEEEEVINQFTDENSIVNSSSSSSSSSLEAD